jgi:hypothetical protein
MGDKTRDDLKPPASLAPLSKIWRLKAEANYGKL